MVESQARPVCLLAGIVSARLLACLPLNLTTAISALLEKIFSCSQFESSPYSSRCCDDRLCLYARPPSPSMQTTSGHAHYGIFFQIKAKSSDVYVTGIRTASHYR